MDLGALLTFAKRSGASDLHLSAGAIPMVRIHGDMRMLEVEGEDLSEKERVRHLLYDFLTDAQKKKLENDWELDCAITLGTGDRFRANFFLQERGHSAVFRVIPTEIKTADDLGLPQAIRDLAELEKGMVLVTGPTGSGKSTTLAALIDHINRNRAGHIITVEDPIEFIHKQRKCMVNQREVGSHTKAFSHALKSALREDPDVILIGEMRDLETMSLAITAAETGHLVFGTLHTSSAAKTVDRIVNVFPADEQAHIRELLAGSIQAIVAQMLLKKRGGGRTAAHEILIATDGARAMIREGKSYQLPSVLQTGARYGMQSLEQALDKMAERGVIERHVVHETLVSAGLRLEEPVTRAPEPARPPEDRDRDRDRGDRSARAPLPSESASASTASSGSPSLADLLDAPAPSATPIRSFSGAKPPSPKPKAAQPPRGDPVLVLGSQQAAAQPPVRGGETQRMEGTVPTLVTPPGGTAAPGLALPPAPPPVPTPMSGTGTGRMTASSRPAAPPPPLPPPYATKPSGPLSRQPGDRTPSEGTRASEIDAMVAKVKEQRKRDGQEPPAE